MPTLISFKRRVSGLQVVTSSILRSIPSLVHVGLLLCFLIGLSARRQFAGAQISHVAPHPIVVYALIGMEFYQGILDSNCFLPTVDGKLRTQEGRRRAFTSHLGDSVEPNVIYALEQPPLLRYLGQRLQSSFGLLFAFIPSSELSSTLVLRVGCSARRVKCAANRSKAPMLASPTLTTRGRPC